MIRYSYKNMSVEDRNYVRYIRAMAAAGRVSDKATYNKKFVEVYFRRCFRAARLASMIPQESRISMRYFTS